MSSNIKFEHVTGGDYVVRRDDDYIGKIRWGTGQRAGWHYQPRGTEILVQVADLDDDMETVFAKCRAQLEPRLILDSAHREALLAIVNKSPGGAYVFLRPDVMMPHQDAVARLLYQSFADIGMRTGMPTYEHLTRIERSCLTADQLSDIATWVAERVTVFCISVMMGGEKRWIHAGDAPAVEIDEHAAAPATGRRVLSSQTRELAQRYASLFVPGAEVHELTVRQLWEACRA